MRQKARRAGDWNGIVPADRARAHMLKLARAGVGRRAIGAATDIADSVLQAIRMRRKSRIRARTERAILAVTKAQASDGAYVSAKPSWKLIDELLEEGFTVKFLAEQFGYKNPALQFNRERVTVRTAGRIERLHRRLTS